MVAYQLNSLFIFMMLFLFNVQLRNKYDDYDDTYHYVIRHVQKNESDIVKQPGP